MRTPQSQHEFDKMFDKLFEKVKNTNSLSDLAEVHRLLFITKDRSFANWKNFNTQYERFADQFTKNA